MAKAVWNGAVLAESDNCQIVENNYYFPADSVHAEYLKQSETHTTCPWKGCKLRFGNVHVSGLRHCRMLNVCAMPLTLYKRAL